MKDNDRELIRCAKCKLVLDEDPSVQPDKRTPCPSCGSTSRSFEVTATAGIGLSASLGMNAKHAGEKKPFIEQISGKYLHRKTNKNVDKTRVIDRENDRYLETITDPQTGVIIHHCDEPLSKHIGHGSAKNKEKSR